MLEMNGLPVYTTMFFWSMVKSATDCNNLGGAIIMAGCLLRLFLMIIESGLQVMLGSSTSGDMHEAVNNSFMGFFFSAMAEIWKAVTALFDVLPRSLLTKPQKIRTALSSWAPARIKGALPDLIGVTVLIMDMIFGKDGWVDIFLNVPYDDPLTTQQCFDTNGYSDVEKVAALNVILRMLRLIEKEGGITAIDTNALALSMSDNASNLVDLMLQRRPFGEDGPCWEVLFVFFRVTVMILNSATDDLTRLIFVFSPPCYAVSWSPTCTSTSYARFSLMAETIISLQFLLIVFGLLKTRNAAVLTYDVMNDKICNNLVFAWAAFAHMCLHLHLPVGVCTVVFKNILVWTEANMFSHRHTGQIRRVDGAYEGQEHIFSCARYHVSHRCSTRRFSRLDTA